MGAAADCELIGEGFLGQPINTVTTLAFLVAGATVMRRKDLRWVGVALIATGVGSFVFHGPMPAGAEWTHDVSLAWLILVVAGIGQPWERWTRLPALAALGLLFALWPAAADPIAVVLTAAALVIILQHDRSRTTVAPLTLLAVTAVVGRLGATGNPLCVPGSPWQTHGLWHLGAAVAVAWYVLVRPADTA